MSAKFLGNIILKGKMECLTGMHIGGSKEKFEIGGVDSPVIRDPNTNYPYIPGSSLKGKMRSLLAFELGFEVIPKGGNKKDYKDKPAIYRIFGTGANDNNKQDGPSRLIIRDAYPDNKTIGMWENLDSELIYTELKGENTIDRLTSAANPRFIERVVKGSVFNVEFIYGVYRVDNTKDEEYFKYVLDGLKLLEHSALGGSGSRGYGQISFKFTEPFLLTVEDYISGSKAFKDSCKPHDTLEDKEGLEFKKRLSDFEEGKLIDKIKEKYGNLN
jgi:CRISPR-associated protein Csm3